MFYLVLCSLIWAFSFGLTKGNLTGLSPDLVAFTRMFIPLLCFFPALKIRFLTKKEIFSFLMIGAIQYGVMYICFIRAYQFLSASQIVFCTACTPIYIVLIGDVFERRFRPFYLLMAVSAFLGPALLYSETFSWGGILRGMGWVQSADICFAFGLIYYKRIRKNREIVSDQNLYALLFLGGTLATAFSTTMFRGWGDLSMISLKQALILLYLGSIASGICFFWWNRAILTVCSGTSAVFSNAKIPLGIFVSILFFGETVDPFLLALSFVLVGGALFLSEWYAKKVERVQKKSTG